MCTRATCAALKALAHFINLVCHFFHNIPTYIIFNNNYFAILLQKSRNNGGRRNHGENGGWI